MIHTPSSAAIRCACLALAATVTACGEERAAVHIDALDFDTLVAGREDGKAGRLWQVGEIAVLSDGSLVVGSEGNQELVVYPPGGEFVRSIGREGDGPGEFRRLRSIWVGEDDSIFAFDVQPQRVVVFGPDGERTRDFPVDPVDGAVQVGTMMRFADGRRLSRHDIRTRVSDLGVPARDSSIWAVTGPLGRAPTPVELEPGDGCALEAVQDGRIIGIVFDALEVEHLVAASVE